MSLPARAAGSDVVVVGLICRLPRHLTDYPEPWDRAMDGCRVSLAHKVASEDRVAVSDIVVSTRYEKRVELCDRPDWATDANDPGPWSEAAETTGPGWDYVVVVMEVACAPR